MLFNSYEYILLFLPIVFCGYFFLNKKHLTTIANIWLVVASLFFYGYLNPFRLIPLILISICLNFAIGSGLSINKSNLKINKKILLILGIVCNLVLLGYFKYMDFFIGNINGLFHSNLGLLHIALPLGISFFTFTQTAYLVDSYQGKTKEYDFLNYALFVTFFPHLVAGPIIHHSEMMPQFYRLKNKFLNWKNLSEGLLLFLIGLVKKVLIADTLAKWANMGFDSFSHLSLLEAWISILSYTFQIYYDFSSYTDMALGVAKMFNINLPQNFNNPYSAIDIQDFWRRWHMTLTRFLKDYVYIPLGGNRKGNVRTYINVFIVFFLCGMWHGASWMFIIWGVIHGTASIINRLWKTTNIELPHWLSCFITFVFLNFTWVFFRAENLTIAKNMIKSAMGLNGFAVPKIYGAIIEYVPHISNIKSWDTIALFLTPMLILVIFIKFFHKVPKNLKPATSYSIFMVVLFIIAMFKILSPEYSSEFIYFNF